jgi:hypothetical protein
MSVLRLRPLACGLFLLGLFGAAEARAQSPEAPAAAPRNAGQRAAAEALFNEGIALLEQGQAAAACPKLEESQRLDAGVGTLLYLADCYRTLGRTASAWGTFLEAAYAARATHDEREAVALEQAKGLEPMLSYLTLEMSPQPGVTVEIKQDGRVVGQGLWGTKVPVDPGEHTLEARAPGYEPWWDKAVIPPGPASQTLRVPALVRLPEVAEPPSAPAPMSVSSSADVASPYQTVGWVLVGTGGAALITGGVFALLAGSDNREADGHCRSDDPSLCNERGVELGDAARTKAAIAGAGAVVGVLGIAGGVTLLLAAPEPPTEAPLPAAARARNKPRLVLRAEATPVGGGVVLGGRW